jgi:hypothetical protein
VINIEEKMPVLEVLINGCKNNTEYTRAKWLLTRWFSLFSYGLFCLKNRALLQIAGTERVDVAETFQTATPEVPGSYLGLVTANEASRVFPQFLHVINVMVTTDHD